MIKLSTSPLAEYVMTFMTAVIKVALCFSILLKNMLGRFFALLVWLIEYR